MRLHAAAGPRGAARRGSGSKSVAREHSLSPSGARSCPWMLSGVFCSGILLALPPSFYLEAMASAASRTSFPDRKATAGEGTSGFSWTRSPKPQARVPACCFSPQRRHRTQDDLPVSVPYCTRYGRERSAGLPQLLKAPQTRNPRTKINKQFLQALPDVRVSLCLSVSL